MWFVASRVTQGRKITIKNIDVRKAGELRTALKELQGMTKDILAVCTPNDVDTIYDNPRTPSTIIDKI